jgi:hypothetical protein
MTALEMVQFSVGSSLTLIDKTYDIVKHYLWDDIYGVGTREVTPTDSRAIWWKINEDGTVGWGRSWGLAGAYAVANKVTIDPLASETIYMAVRSNIDSIRGTNYPRIWIIGARTSDGRHMLFRLWSYTNDAPTYSYPASVESYNGWIEIGKSGYLYHLWTTNGMHPHIMSDECDNCAVPWTYYPTLTPVL